MVEIGLALCWPFLFYQTWIKACSALSANSYEPAGEIVLPFHSRFSRIVENKFFSVNNSFYIYLINLITMPRPRHNDYNPLEKDTMRIHDLVKKAKGNYSKIPALARTMAARITEPRKAAARAIAADKYATEMLLQLDADSFSGLSEACEVFKKRAEELGVNITLLKQRYGLESGQTNDIDILLNSLI